MSVRLTLTMDRRLTRQAGMDAARKVVSRVTRRTFARSAILCPVDVGRLRASGKINLGERGDEYRGAVEYDVDYAAAVHNGRGPLTIRARKRRALRFTVGGRVVFARSVHQPARAGRPFLTTALRETAAREGFGTNPRST